MPNEPPIQIYRRTLEERYVELKRLLDELLREFGTGRPVEFRVGLAREAHQQTQTLRLILPKNDQPGWLAQIDDVLGHFRGDPNSKDNGSRLNMTIARHWTAINSQKWDLDEGPPPFDFDGTYSKYFSESKIPDLFDELIRLLEKVLSEKDEDGRYVINERQAVESLRTLIATLKRNRRNPSHSTLLFIWRASRLFVDSLIWEALNEYTVLKVLIPAFQKTMQELDKEVIAVDTRTREDVRAAVSVELPKLECHSYPLLEHVPEQNDETTPPAE